MEVSRWVSRSWPASYLGSWASAAFGVHTENLNVIVAVVKFTKAHGDCTRQTPLAVVSRSALTGSLQGSSCEYCRKNPGPHVDTMTFAVSIQSSLIVAALPHSDKR